MTLMQQARWARDDIDRYHFAKDADRDVASCLDGIGMALDAFAEEVEDRLNDLEKADTTREHQIDALERLVEEQARLLAELQERVAELEGASEGA